MNAFRIVKSVKSPCQDMVPYRYARLWKRALGVMLILILTASAQAQEQKASEYKIKATYLYTFGHFVQWPANATTIQSPSFSICVIGEDPFGAVLDGILVGETIDGKAVVAKRVATPQEALDCRVLFISSSEDSRLKEILGPLEKAGVLTVSDIPQFSRRGGMIEFIMVSNKIRFAVNLSTAHDAGLILSSDLLKVAAAVMKTSQVED